MITYIDTNEVDAISRELATLTKDLDAEFNYLFKRFANVPNVTKEWVGNQANYYFSRVDSDKQAYTTFTNELKNISRELGTVASSTQLRIKSNNSEK